MSLPFSERELQKQNNNSGGEKTLKKARCWLFLLTEAGSFLQQQPGWTAGRGSIPMSFVLCKICSFFPCCDCSLQSPHKGAHEISPTELDPAESRTPFQFREVNGSNIIFPL